MRFISKTVPAFYPFSKLFPLSSTTNDHRYPLKKLTLIGMSPKFICEVVLTKRLVTGAGIEEKCSINIDSIQNRFINQCTYPCFLGVYFTSIH